VNLSLNPSVIIQSSVARLAGAILLACAAFGVCLAVIGKDPFAAYSAILSGALGDSYGWSELGAKLIPVVLCALAAAIPARVGLVNVGAEGQFYGGALVATSVALNLDMLPGFVLLPLMLIAGFTGGALWGGIAGLLRIVGLNEAISTLLLNYVAVLLVDQMVHGPWKEPGGNNWPFTVEFVPAALIPAFGDWRIHFGIFLPIIGVAVFAYVLARTRWGFEMRVIGGNPEAGRWSGLPAAQYFLAALLIGGGLAGLAGMAVF
jgi:general nucleoside transport system permease protein